jgi:hypothetical protein
MIKDDSMYVNYGFRYVLELRISVYIFTLVEVGMFGGVDMHSGMAIVW